jgi:hypothetical protein
MKSTCVDKLCQLHHQNTKDFNHTIFVSQKQIQDSKEMQAWTKDVQERHPLPDGYMWMCCKWDSKHFVKAVLE